MSRMLSLGADFPAVLFGSDRAQVQGLGFRFFRGVGLDLGFTGI